MRPAATITVATLISIDAAGLTGDEDGDGVGGVVSRRRVAEYEPWWLSVTRSTSSSVAEPETRRCCTESRPPRPFQSKYGVEQFADVALYSCRKQPPHRNSKHCLKTDYNKSVLNLEPWHSTRRCCALAPAAAIERYLLPAPELSSKPAAHVAVDIDRRDKQTDGQTDSRPSQRRLPSTT